MSEEKCLIRQGQKSNGVALYMNVNSEGLISWHSNPELATRFSYDDALDAVWNRHGDGRPWIIISSSELTAKVVHTFTDTELARFVAVACREQRYACVDAIKGTENFRTWHSFAAAAQNAPAPTFEHVMEKYEELKEL